MLMVKSAGEDAEQKQLHFHTKDNDSKSMHLFLLTVQADEKKGLNNCIIGS